MLSQRSAHRHRRPQATLLPPHIEPLVLWEPPEGEAGPVVEVDAMLTQFLRPHQREGVQFMFECVAGLKGFGGRGPFPSFHALRRRFAAFLRVSGSQHAFCSQAASWRTTWA